MNGLFRIMYNSVDVRELVREQSAEGDRHLIAFLEQHAERRLSLLSMYISLRDNKEEHAAASG